MIAGRVRWRCAIAAITVLSSIAAIARGAPRALPIESLLDLETIELVDVSPDGEWVAALINRPHRGSSGVEQATQTAVRLIQLRGKREIIEPVDAAALSVAWSPDSTELAFEVGAAERAELWVWSRATGRARPVMGSGRPLPPIRVSALSWTPDGQHIIAVLTPASATVSPPAPALPDATRGYPLDASTPGARVAVYRASERPAESSSQGSTAGRQEFEWNASYEGDLVAVEPATGEWRRLTNGYRPVSIHVSPDGQHVAFTSITGQAEGSAFRNLYDVMVLRTEGGEPRRVARDVQQSGSLMDFSWSPDSRRLAYCESGPGVDGDCYVVTALSGETKRIRPSEPAAERLLSDRVYRAPLWAPDSEHFYTLNRSALWRASVTEATAQRIAAPAGQQLIEIVAPRDEGRFATSDGRSLTILTRDHDTQREAFYRIDPLTRAARSLMSEAKRHGRTPFYVTDTTTDGRRTIYSAEAADAGPQLWQAEANFRHPQPITQLNPHLRPYQMGRSRLVRWYSHRGEALQGALLLPASYTVGKRYPLIINLYGDKALSEELNCFGIVKYTTNAFQNMQLFATRGFAVLRPDTLTHVGTPMSDIAGSVLPAVDRLIDEGVVDPERLGIMGHSYGGYSTLATIVQSPRFKAAVVSAANPNLVGVFSNMNPDGTHAKVSWAEESQGKMGGTLWDYRERYIENSPLFYLDRVATPVLILHGAADRTVFPHHGDELFQALRRLGKEVEYAKYLDERHVVRGRANSIDYANRTIAWFEKYLHQ